MAIIEIWGYIRCTDQFNCRAYEAGCDLTDIDILLKTIVLDPNITQEEFEPIYHEAHQEGRLWSNGPEDDCRRPDNFWNGERGVFRNRMYTLRRN